MICPICRKEINDNAKFCPLCGKQIPRCPKCGKVLYKKMSFCPDDGTPIPAEVFSTLTASPASAPQGTANRPTPAPQNVSNRPAPVPQNPAGRPQEQPAPKQSSGSIGKIVLAILCAVLLIGLAAYIGFSVAGKLTNSDEPESRTEQTVKDEKSKKPRKNKKTEEPLPDEEEEETAAEEEETIEETEVEITETVETEAVETETAVADEAADNKTDPVEYFIMNCDKEYFQKEYFYEFDAEMCRTARNGIYARFGRKFQDPALTDYFLQFDWYTPTIEPDAFSDSMLNNYQVANRDVIVAYEKEKGFR